MRWAEMVAFTAVTRTHEGNRPGDNVQLDSSPDILAHFARMVRMFVDLRRSGARWWKRRFARAAAETSVVAAFPGRPDRSRHRGCLLPRPRSARRARPSPGFAGVVGGAAGGRGLGPCVVRDVPGGQSVTVRAPLGQPPIFFRAGSAHQRVFQSFPAIVGKCASCTRWITRLPLQSGYVYRSTGHPLRAAQFRLGDGAGDRASQNAYRGAWDEMDGWRFHRTRRVPKALHIPGVRGGAEMWALRQRLIQVMREAGPDLMHAHSPVQFGWPAFLAAGGWRAVRLRESVGYGRMRRSILATVRSGTCGTA